MGYIMELRRELGSRPIIMAGTGVILVNGKNEILLGRRTDNGFWDYPGGSMELGESFEDCARREVLEETGLTCGKLEFLMDVSGQESFYRYPNGDQVYIAGIVYLCRDFTGQMKVQEEEVAEQRFFPIDRLPENLVPGSLKKRIFDKVREILLEK
ncbi:MAG: NUDIX hydrolase [Ruminococcus sp.]|nr:NUDIX hydrolase [Ruminococcus sp.]MBP8594728.1 NUDIX hydrolase [Ruminococcus sp.]MBQ3855899.1 NUDIX hydrolase [Ruminococcus sp.]HOO08135.1 NUDIX hydrolase [Ruminococcus sp.]HOR21372.1 NUDIX hydrolase [Ruminococcus sp.]